MLSLCMYMKVKVKVVQLCPILQARILEWVAFLFFRGSSQPRYWTQVSLILKADSLPAEPLYIYIDIHIYISIYIYIYIYIYIHTHIHICICVCVSLCTCMHMLFWISICRLEHVWGIYVLCTLLNSYILFSL